MLLVCCTYCITFNINILFDSVWICIIVSAWKNNVIINAIHNQVIPREYCQSFETSIVIWIISCSFSLHLVHPIWVFFFLFFNAKFAHGYRSNGFLIKLAHTHAHAHTYTHTQSHTHTQTHASNKFLAPFYSTGMSCLQPLPWIINLIRKY